MTRRRMRRTTQLSSSSPQLTLVVAGTPSALQKDRIAEGLQTVLALAHLCRTYLPEAWSSVIAQSPITPQRGYDVAQLLVSQTHQRVPVITLTDRANRPIGITVPQPDPALCLTSGRCRLSAEQALTELAECAGYFERPRPIYWGCGRTHMGHADADLSLFQAALLWVCARADTEDDWLCDDNGIPTRPRLAPAQVHLIKTLPQLRLHFPILRELAHLPPAPAGLPPLAAVLRYVLCRTGNVLADHTPADVEDLLNDYFQMCMEDDPWSEDEQAVLYAVPDPPDPFERTTAFGEAAGLLWHWSDLALLTRLSQAAQDARRQYHAWSNWLDADPASHLSQLVSMLHATAL